MKKQLVFGIVLGAIVLGLGFAGFARATNDPIPGVDIVVRRCCNQITASDLGVDSVGMLPTSRFYFLKELGQGIRRLFTFGALNKAQFELDTTNHKAAEMIAVDAAHPDDAEALRNVLQNVANAQKRLNTRLAKVTAVYGWNQTAGLTKQVDEKTALHLALVQQVVREHEGQPEYATLLLPYFEVDLSSQKTFQVLNTGALGFNNTKQNAADGIASAATALQKAETTFGQPVTFTATVVPTGGGAAPSDNKIFLACANGHHIKDAVLTINVTPVNDAPVPGIHLTVRKAGGEATTTSTDQSGCFELSNLTPGTYDLSIAGQVVKSLIVGTDGGVWRGAVTYTGTTDVQAGRAHEHHYLGTVTLVRGTVPSPTATPGTHTITAVYSGSVQYIVIANAKGSLASAKEAVAEGNYGEAYGLTRSAEASARGLFVAVGDLNGDGRPDDKTVPTSTPTPKPVTPKPSPKTSVAPTATPTPMKTETPKPSPTEQATPTPTPSENPMGPASPTPTETGSPL